MAITKLTVEDHTKKCVIYLRRWSTENTVTRNLPFQGKTNLISTKDS